MVKNPRIMGIMREFNMELHKEFYENNDSEVYRPTILKFLNDLDGFKAKFFNDISEISCWIQNFNDIEELQKYYNVVDGDITDTLGVYEYVSGLYFVQNKNVFHFVDTVLSNLDNEETIQFNKYIMNKLYEEDYK